MDEKNFDNWTRVLEDLRQARKKQIEEKINSLGVSFDAKTFFAVSKTSLEDICLKWWFMTQESWAKNPPSDRYVELANLKEEVESLIELETEAIENELGELNQTLNLSEQDMSKERPALESYALDLKKTYKIKIDSLLGSKKTEEDQKPIKPVSASMGGGGASSGGVLTMFLFGLLIGAAAAFYYWDQGNKAEEAFKIESKKLKDEMKEIQGRIDIIQESFSNVAYGKTPTIPQIQARIRPIKNKFDAQKKNIERDFAAKRKNILQRVPPGDRQDLSLQTLDKEKERLLDQVRVKEKAALGALYKQLNTIKELLGEEVEG